MLEYALDPDLASKINPAIHFLRFANMIAEDSEDVRRSLIDAGVLFLLVSITDLLKCACGLVFTGEEDFSPAAFKAAVDALFYSVQGYKGFRIGRVDWWTATLHRAIIVLLGDDPDYCKPRDKLLSILEFESLVEPIGNCLCKLVTGL